MKPLRVIELFSGVGSQRMAFNIVSDRTGIQFDFVAQCDCDILTWSFPCQSLSQAGKKEGMVKGSGTESSLAWEVIRLLECSHRPDWLVMENVPAITYKTNIKQFNQIITALAKLGYYSKYKVLDATDYNVAQTRSRCLMVSRLGEMPTDFPKPIGCTHTLNDYLESAPDVKYYLSKKRLQNAIAESERERARGNGFSFKPCPKNGIAHTITTVSDRKTNTFVDDGERMKPILCGSLSLSEITALMPCVGYTAVVGLPLPSIRKRMITRII